MKTRIDTTAPRVRVAQRKNHVLALYIVCITTVMIAYTVITALNHL